MDRKEKHDAIEDHIMRAVYRCVESIGPISKEHGDLIEETLAIFKTDCESEVHQLMMEALFNTLCAARSEGSYKAFNAFKDGLELHKDLGRMRGTTESTRAKIRQFIDKLI